MKRRPDRLHLTRESGRWCEKKALEFVTISLAWESTKLLWMHVPTLGRVVVGRSQAA